LKKSFIFVVLILLILPIAKAHANFELNLNKGIASYMEEKYPESIKFLEMALEEKPDDARANHLAGLAYYRINEYKKASDHLENAKNIDPDIKDINLDLGASYIKQDRYEDAQKVLTTHIEKNPDSGIAYYYLGYCQFSLADYKDALDSFEKASGLNADLSMQSSYYSGVSYYLINDYENASASFTRVIELAPEDRLAKSSDEYLRVINRLFKKYYANFTVGYQYDTNVALEPEDLKIVSDEKDSSLFMYLNMGYKPYFTKDAVLGVDYKTFFSFHNHLDQYNVQNHKFSLYGEKNIDGGPRPMRAFLNYSYELVLIDGSPADELFSQSNSITPGLTIRWSDRATSRIFYQFRYDNFEDFDERDAYNNRITLAQYYRYLDGRLIISPAIGFELNSAKDISNKRNYSYWSPEAYIDILASLPYQSTLYSRVHYNYENYYDDSFNRVDNQFGVKFLLSKELYKYIYMDVAYEFIYNDSSSDFPGPEPYKYNRNLITLGLSFRI